MWRDVCCRSISPEIGRNSLDGTRVSALLGAGLPRLRSQVSDTIDRFNRKLYEHQVYIQEHLADLPEIVNWHWTSDFSEPASPPPPAEPVARQTFTDM